MQNLKKIQVTVESEEVARLINSTPAFNKILRQPVKVGTIEERVNHWQYSQALRMLPIVGAKVTELK